MPLSTAGETLGNGTGTGALGYRALPLCELNPRLNAETAVIVMLETTEGIENCKAIAAVDGIDPVDRLR